MEHPEVTKDIAEFRRFVRDYAKNHIEHNEWNVVSRCDKFSMLHPETLTLLWYFSRNTKGWALEIGPYVGGSTVAAASARINDGRKIISIEVGGAYPEHPHVPSKDIISDLKGNIAKHGVASNVVLLNGPSYNESIIAEVNRLVGEEKIDLLFIDADGDVGRDIKIFEHLLSDGCIMILDDYASEEAYIKVLPVRKWITEAVEEGVVTELAVVKWGTWIGRHNKVRIPQIAARNPDFDDGLVVWNDAYRVQYQPIAYSEQFDDQWRLYMDRVRGFHNHTGVETSDSYIDDRIEELTGFSDFLMKRHLGKFYPLVKNLGRIFQNPQRRNIGGRLYLEPKFPLDFFKGKQCLDFGCGAGRWTRTLLELGGKVKSVDVSEHALQSTRRFNDDVESLDIFDVPNQTDLLAAFDFVLCWGVLMCTHDPRLAFENVASTVKLGGTLYVMVYAPTYHASDEVREMRKKFHRDCRTADERLRFVNTVSADPDNAINYMDMLNTFYNWTIPEDVVHGWFRECGFDNIITLNKEEPHNCAWHVIGIKK